MRSLVITVSILLLSISSFAQQSTTWAKWQWLIGDWQGEGTGKPGAGTGTFSFKPDLNEKILVRKSHSEYPAAPGKPAISHDDLMIVYPDYSGAPSKAIYFDNEGHTINYTIAYIVDGIVLTSDLIPHVPTFRLTYSLLHDETINTKFEMSQDGEKFKTYVEGLCKRKKG